MNSKSDAQLSNLDSIKWVIAFLLVVVGVWTNYHFSEIAWALRLVGWIVLSVIIIALLSQTSKGKAIWELAKGARSELRKVTWPTREETIRFTFAVIVMVILMAMILWGIDSVLLWIIRLLTGQRG